MALNYFIIYKPYEVLSQFSKEGSKAVLGDYFDVPRDVYPVGRLDFDSEGLLILTNDKSLNHRLLNPQFAHNRTYWVQVDGAITPEAVQKLRKGVDIKVDGKTHHTRPAIVEVFEEEPFVPERNPPIRVRKSIPAPWIALTLKEGKNRQVRKMTAAVGFPTLRLIRYSIGKLTIDSLQPGDIVELSQASIYEALFK
ncbi:23S rRNA pseudouridine2457 synthase [Chitinophaga skermanii]|uniref:Pseudouridine synthase n=1 Tax=Chitinophaga skermanii TaxID=331697 RepID=A0A327QE60_9BACT|nr:pseudouridine synthase [Chitinophaga skermanii]RAJ01563.1 23S rRNA pseudouridine2457 synthase [Chitinophaga skermanii]